jgi:hypothetical protein
MTQTRRHFLFITLLISGVLIGSLVANPQTSLKPEQELAYFADESRIDELLASLSAESTVRKTSPYAMSHSSR